ncbi:hypothetical protein CY34DRAFT_393301 [Suillus luteus UH-Slu-Lm8-n1]|uniref:DUF6533 domain-containing protein n=1 Tax=Suillus luteus UH-Slu-Lm8-n1 TaxID=930992 RepID=A0A0D0AK38_9AGAM|nr:hypothetical protein CY34DRAFT_393301 [Suillus luteus UH-Slu-Lm8-n1]
MIIVSNDPTWWPSISSYRVTSYVVVASFVVVIYDWALTFGQEVELVWVRYLGIISAVLNMISGVPTISVTDAVSFVVFAMLWVIIITRLHAMYQGSRKIQIFLIVTFLTLNIFNGVLGIMSTTHSSGEEFILSGTYQCSIGFAQNALLLDSTTWILATVWEVITLCLAARIAVRRFCELRRHSAGYIFRDCFTVLMKTHLIYFASFVAVSCLSLVVLFSPTISVDQETQFYYGFLQILTVVQSFVLGPRLILGIREHHAKLVANSDAATAMTSIAFQERVHISTGNGV